MTPWCGTVFRLNPPVKKPLSFSNDRGFSFVLNLIFETNYLNNRFDLAALTSRWQSGYFFNLNGHNFYINLIRGDQGDFGDSLFSKLVH